jgi:hypothetical protein
MPKISSGSVIRRLGERNEPGVAGCLVHFPGDPDKLFWLTLGQVLVSSEAAQFDRVEATDLPDQTIGRLYGWTNLDSDVTDVTVDAALVWVDPDLVLPEIQGFGVPRDINPLPNIGDKLRIFVKGQRHEGTIQDNGVDAEVTMIGPDFSQNFTFRSQITCTGFDTADCKGAIALDNDGLVVGMVVARGEKTVITPIEAILGHPDWGQGDPLQLVTDVPQSAVPPLVPDPKRFVVPTSSTLEDAFRAALRFNEIGDNGSPYELCFASKGRSGCSFGFMQGDLAAGEPIVQKTFHDALAAAGIPAGQIDGFAQKLSGPLPRNPLSRADTRLINEALDRRPSGRQLVDAMDAALFANSRNDLNVCIAKANASSRRITPEAQIQMLLWMNMTGRPTILLDFVSGKDVRRVSAPGNPIDGPAMERFLKATKFFTENPENLNHFQAAVQKGMALLGPGLMQGVMPGLIAAAKVDQSDLDGKTRDKPITEELEDLLARAAAAVGIDVVRVVSGGQPGTSGQRTGSTRHDGGRAADIELIVGGGALTFTDQQCGPVIEAFVRTAAALGATGIGAGERYMGNNKIHVGFGKSPEDRSTLVWGAGGKSANAPDWLLRAAQQGWNSPLPPPRFAQGEDQEEV